MRSSNNLGDQIKDVVQDAMDAMDFHNLNQKIQRSVSSALHEVRKTIGPYQQRDGSDPNSFGEGFGSDSYRDGFGTGPNTGRRTGNFHDQFFRDTEFRRCRTVRSRQPEPVSMNKPVGKVAGIVMIILSSIGVTAFGIASLVLHWVAEFIDSYYVFGPLIAVFMTIFIVSFGFLLKGVSLKNRTKRFYLYEERLKEHNYFQIKDVATFLGKSNKWVANDLLKMIRLGMFPQGHLDDKKTCFIGDNATYQQYRKVEQDYEERRRQEEERKQKEASATEEEKAALMAKSLGDSYVTQVREANDVIEDEVMSQKLDRLEQIIKKIFEHVAKYPQQLSEIRKFIDYYLPITIKLVNAYKDFEHQEIQSTNIVNSRKEIEASMDTINDAFEKLFDSLYEDVAMEVATDISVLNTLLAQEGLTKKDFKVK